MKNIKYTSDGKKVVVVGNLNAQETIVQEVFIVNEQEIPSGENFVVKSLHDAPSISWKEKRILDIEKRYEKEYNNREREIEDLNKKHREVSKEFRNKIDYIKKATNKISEETFDLLADYITGEIKYILVTGYDCEILNMSEFNESYENKLRLLSFYGMDDGSFTYSIGQYYDYSGGNKGFIPFKTKAEAIEKLNSLLNDKKEIGSRDKELAEKYGIELDKTKLEELKTRSIKSIQKTIDSTEDSLSKLKDSMKELHK